MSKEYKYQQLVDENNSLKEENKSLQRRLMRARLEIESYKTSIFLQEYMLKLYEETYRSYESNIEQSLCNVVNMHLEPNRN